MQQTIETRPRQTLTIKPSTGWVPLNLKELLQFRDLLFVLAGRDIKLRYRQTLMGPIWIIFEPLMAAGVFTFIFHSVAKMPTPGNIPPFVYTFSGLLGWNLFSGVIMRSSSSLISGSHLVAKVYFPRLILPLSSVVSTLVDFTVALGLMAVLLALNHVWPGVALLTLPFWMLLFFMLGLGIGLTAAAISVAYRDVSRVLGVFMSFMMWASPVAYAATSVPKSLHRIYGMNPITVLLEGLRWSVTGVGTMSLARTAYAAAFAALLMVAGAYLFKRMERQFADII